MQPLWALTTLITEVRGLSGRAGRRIKTIQCWLRMVLLQERGGYPALPGPSTACEGRGSSRHLLGSLQPHPTARLSPAKRWLGQRCLARELRPAAGAVLCHRSWRLRPLAETLSANSGEGEKLALSVPVLGGRGENPLALALFPAPHANQLSPTAEHRTCAWECSGTSPALPISLKPNSPAAGRCNTAL